MARNLLPVVLLLTVALGGALSTEAHIVLEKRDGISARWHKLGRVRPAAILPVRIGLAQSNVNEAHDFLMDV